MKNKNNEKKTADKQRAKVFGFEFSNWAKVNWKAIFGYMGYPVFFFAWFYISQARIEHNQILDTIAQNEKKIEQVTETVQGIYTWQAVSDKKWAEIANSLEQQNNKEVAEQIRRLLKELDEKRGR